MPSKGWTRGFIVMVLLLLLMTGVTIAIVAQQANNFATNPQTAFIRAEPVQSVIQQAVPFTFTLRVANGLTGTEIVTVPVLLQLSIQMSLNSGQIQVSAAPTLEIPGITMMAATASPTQTATLRPPPTTTSTPLPPTSLSPEKRPTPTVLGQATISPTLTTITNTAVVTTATVISNASPTLTVTTPLTTSTDPVGLIAPLCPDEGATISSPGVYQNVSGLIAIRGSVRQEKFQSYKLEYIPGADVMQNKLDYIEFGSANKPVQNNILGTLDTRPLPPGANTIRLTVTDQAGQTLPTCFVIVSVRN
ncbi:MAG: hypothetical protein NT075_17230 [Chloroflexi bacterium]|nr:hypothetical protein [Chloroflexota bacterium]